MNDLLSALTAVATSLHSDRVESIAAAVLHIPGPAQFDQCLAAFGSAGSLTLAGKIRSAWLANPTVTGAEIAMALRAAVHAATTMGISEGLDLVWTGPKTGLIPTRNTEQVIREVIDQATRRLFVVSYVFFNAKSIVTGLNDAIERGVRIRILLESSTAHGGAVTGDGLQAMHEAVPGADLYIWPLSQKAEVAGSLSAAVHAKCVVCDERIAFITSANLTSAAMERNMELGVLVRGGTTPHRLHAHLDALVSTGTITNWR